MMNLMSVTHGHIAMKEHTSGAPSPRVLRRRLSEWTAIVELFACRRAARKSVEPGAYCALRQELIMACRSLADEDPSNAATYRSLEEMILPWITPQTLDRTDHELLVFLLNRCRQVERRFRGRLGRVQFSRRIVPIALGAVGIAVILLWSGKVDAILASLVGRLQDWSTELWIAIKWSTDLQRIFAIGVVLLIVSLFAVVRTARS
jgi:hypothetical protein